MTKQSLSKEDAVNINLILAHVKCLSELLHTLPEHKYQFKSYFKELFDTVKDYEIALNKMTNYEDLSEDQDIIYDKLMEITYTVRDIILNNSNE
jgi:uncharacterized FlgJ-related protein